MKERTQNLAKKCIESNAVLELEKPCWIQFKKDKLKQISTEANMPISY